MKPFPFAIAPDLRAIAGSLATAQQPSPAPAGLAGSPYHRVALAPDRHLTGTYPSPEAWP